MTSAVETHPSVRPGALAANIAHFVGYFGFSTNCACVWASVRVCNGLFRLLKGWAEWVGRDVCPARSTVARGAVSNFEVCMASTGSCRGQSRAIPRVRAAYRSSG